MNVNAFLQKDYENEPPSGSKKTKPKQTQSCPPQADSKMSLKLLTKKSGRTLPGCAWRTTLYLVTKKVTIYQSIQRFLLTEAIAASVRLQRYIVIF